MPRSHDALAAPRGPHHHRRLPRQGRDNHLPRLRLHRAPADADAAGHVRRERVPTGVEGEEKMRTRRREETLEEQTGG